MAEYAYDHSGLRLKKNSAGHNTYYVFGLNGEVLYEQEDRDYMEYIYVLGQHFARVDGTLDSAERTKYFYHTDHLGSTILVTDTAGQTVWSAEYTPFGIVTVEEGSLRKAGKFTGKDLDEDTGLYYYNARWYDSEIGRFISEDTYQGELNNPQTLNLYIYVQNNPLIYVDPSGHDTMGRVEAYNYLKEKEKNPDLSYMEYMESLGYDYSGWTVNDVKQISDIGLDFVPLVGDIKGIGEALYGKSLVTGEKLAWWERALGLVCLTELRTLKYGDEVVEGAVDAARKTNIVTNSAENIIEDAPKIIDDFDSFNHVDEIIEGMGEASSTALRKNLIEAGVNVPDYANAAHHIVAGTSKKASEARVILQKFGIGINDASNGVFLPTVKNVANSAYHPSLHTNAYYNKVNDMLRGATSRNDVLDILDDIAGQLTNGTFLK